MEIVRTVENGFIVYQNAGPASHARVIHFHPTHADMLAMTFGRNGDLCYVASDGSLHSFNGTSWRHVSFRDEVWTGAHKTADEAVTSSTTPHNDAALRFPMAANAKYQVRGKLFFDTVAAADFKWRHAGPAAPALVRIFRQWISPGQDIFEGLGVDVAYSGADLAVTGSGTTGGYVEFGGLIHNGATAGDFVIQWAQNSANAGVTTVRAGSYLEWRLLV